jgi:peptide/nickel transport system permease protein
MGIGNYAVKRLLLLVPVLLGITAVVFLLVQLTPGSPITVLLPPNARTPSQIAALRNRLGLDQPLYIQYIKWVTNAAQGDLGRSYATRQPVTEMIVDHLWPTLELAAVALFVALFVAIPVGILSAVYKDTAIDHFGRIGAFLGISMPSFWVGIMAILVFALFWQEWFGFQVIPAGGYVSPAAGFVPWLRHIVAPGLVLGLGFAALTTRLTRAAMLEVLNEDYIRTARSKGVKESTVVLVHGFKNAFIPVLTVLGLQLGFLINGSVVIEQVFQWPGIGQLLYTAVEQRDMPLIQGIVLLIAIVFVFANLAVDLLYAFLDPRIKYD